MRNEVSQGLGGIEFGTAIQARFQRSTAPQGQHLCPQ